MPLDKDTATFLQQLAGAPDLSSLTPDAARALSFVPPADPDAQGSDDPVPVARVADQQIPGPAGPLSLRVYEPLVPGSKGALVYFHGGGWLLGDLDSHDAICRRLSGGAGITVIAVDYRLAPETPFPGAVDDCYAAVEWVASNAAALDIDPLRIAVGGDSAGGNLAAAVTLQARDRAWPNIRFQLLVYPVTDARFDTASYRDNASGYLLTKASMMWFWDHYVPNPADRSHQLASVLRADSLVALPPALVLTAEYDPLRDEGEAYANALRSAGVSVNLIRYAGLIHGFFGMWDTVPASRESMREATTALRTALA